MSRITINKHRHTLVDVKLRKQGEGYIILAECPCGETHIFNGGTKEKLYIVGVRKATCGRILFTTLDTSDQESNRHTFEILRWQGAKWRHRKAQQSIKRNKKLQASLHRSELELLIEKHNATIKAIKESPGLLESLKRLEIEYLQQNKNF